MPSDEYLIACQNPACLRKVAGGSRYCCAPCSAAHEWAHEVHDHSEGCEERTAARGGEWTAYEALARRPVGSGRA